MRFFIDGSEWSYPHMDALPVEEQIESVREKVASEDRIIMDFLCDGESLTEDELQNIDAELDVDVITASPHGVALEALNEINKSLLEIFKALQTILDGNQMFDPSMLDTAYDQLDWMDEVFDSMRSEYSEYRGNYPDTNLLRDGLADFRDMLSLPDYMRAQAWHEENWKKEIMPQFASPLKAMHSFFAGDGDESED